MKTCISWTKVCTNVNFHDHEEVLTIIVSDLWLSNDLMWPLGLLTQCMRILKMKFIIIKKRQAFSKIPLWRHQLLTWLNRKLTWTPSFCYYKNLSLVYFVVIRAGTWTQTKPHSYSNLSRIFNNNKVINHDCSLIEWKWLNKTVILIIFLPINQLLRVNYCAKYTVWNSKGLTID